MIGLISVTITLFSFSVVTISRRNITHEKLAMMGKLSSRISHDLKNPLAILKMLVEQNALDVPQDEIQTLRNKKMNRAISKMTNQIDNILNFVKDHELVMKNVSLFSLFDHTIEYVELTSSVKIQKEGNDCMLLCDFYKIEIVFENIVLNAIQAMKNVGNITLRASDTENHVIIIIENDGPDIPDDILPNIFELLFSTKTTGTGLGLNSCRTIVEQHGGTIEAFNAPTRFILTFPKTSS